MRFPVAIVLALLLATLAPTIAAPGVYQKPETFLGEAFGGDIPPPSVIWLTREVREGARAVTGERFRGLRQRYWIRGTRTAWILEAIGKSRPITVGIIVEDGHIERIRVLTFRESRGWEIRLPAFTAQFDGAALNSRNQLDRTIDGISGATLSVRALKKMARLALYFHSQAPAANVEP